MIPQFAVLCGVILAHAQPATASGVIRSTTRLVEISVVVLDKKSNQVTGLTRGDFQMLDEGVQRNISFFTGAGVAPAAAGRAPATTGQSGATPAAITVSNREGMPPGSNSVSIILIDEANTAWTDLLFARAQVLRFLR